MKVNAGNLKKGNFVFQNSEIWQIQKAEFYSPGKGSALMKTKLKSLNSGKNVSHTYKSGEIVEILAVDCIEMQYLYKDNISLYFMNERDYNQYTILIATTNKVVDFIKEGAKYFVYVYEDKALTIRPPTSVILKIIKTEDAIKGNTASGGARKAAKVETGVTVMVPLFVKNGESIIINPETGQYVERVKA